MAARIEHTSKVRGDFAGYDILSFDVSGAERLIEVKTTSFGERTPFFVSANEVRFSKATGEQFKLYRLFDFKGAPKMFELEGSIDQHCMLDPTTYRASFA